MATGTSLTDRRVGMRSVPACLNISLVKGIVMLISIRRIGIVMLSNLTIGVQSSVMPTSLPS